MEEKDYHALFNLAEEHSGIYDILRKVPKEERSQFIYDALARQYSIKRRLEKDKNVLFDIVSMKLSREEVMENNNISEIEWKAVMNSILKIADREKKSIFDTEWSESE